MGRTLTESFSREFPPERPPLDGKKYVSIGVYMNHAFSRGTIHVRTSDPLVDPAIDPHYWERQIGRSSAIQTVLARFQVNYSFLLLIDRDILVEGIKYIREIVQAAPLREEIGESPTFSGS